MGEETADNPVYHYPNKMGRIILLALEEVLGRNGINAVLNVADVHHLIGGYPPNNFDPGFPFSDMAAINQALEDMYGPRAGRGVALRAGRAAHKYGLRDFGPIAKTSELSFRLLPLNMKIKVGSEVFAETFNEYTDQMVRIEMQPGALLWHNERCPVCWGRKTSGPCCHLTVGILQEMLYWLSGGKSFMVEETACIAVGDSTCTIRVDKKPLD
jgi:predicted hydrocarbon binding protein